jgi:hypothetical protein
MGRAASYFITRRQQGKHTEEVAAVYRDALRHAFGLAQARGETAAAAGGKP